MCWVLWDFREQTAHSGHAVAMPGAQFRCQSVCGDVASGFLLIPLALRGPESRFRRVGGFPLLAAAPGSG